MMFEIKNKVGGHYRFHKGKVDANGEPIPGTHHEVASFKNLVTNQGMNFLYLSTPLGGLSTFELFPACFVGTGNTTPAFTDTELDTYLATYNSYVSTTNVYVNDSDGHYWRYLRVFRFSAGTATGNLTEVGVGRRNDLLQSRALILDGGGSPTTITVLADEYLDVTYEWRNYIDVSDKTLVATISGVPYDVTYRPADIDTAPSINYPIAGEPGGNQGLMRVRETQTLGALDSEPSGAASVDLGLVVAPYVTDSWYADMTGSWALDAANFATGIGSLFFLCTQAKYQFSFDPKIPKDATKILTITVRVSWDRY